MPMKLHKWKAVRRTGKLSENQLARIDREAKEELQLEMSLRELRTMAGKNQVEVAATLEKAQSEISKLERREDWLLSTLKRYIEALGGELEVVAKFGDKSVRLRGV
jgi:predicted transcriptional regulator